MNTRSSAANGQVRSVLIVLTLTLSPTAQAQCGADGLDLGPCCTPACPTLPQIPALQLDGRWLCFDDCSVSLDSSACVDLGPLMPTPALCGVYRVDLQIKDCATGSLFWNGTLRAFYSRTWLESTGAQTLQVWRFVVNGDLVPTAAVTGPDSRPACTATYPGVYFSGYMDYATDCSGAWQVAFALSHEGNLIHHRPGTARPTVPSSAHPSRSFSIVGPGSTFMADVLGAECSGLSNVGALRWNDWANPSGLVSTMEEPSAGAFFAQSMACIYSASGPLQYSGTAVDIRGTCNSDTLLANSAIPFLQKRIGRWTNPAQFPGLEFALFEFGLLDYWNGCATVTTTEWAEGGGTVGGFPAFDITTLQPLHPEFVDLGTCNRSPTNPARWIGAPHVVNYHIHKNEP